MVADDPAGRTGVIALRRATAGVFAVSVTVWVLSACTGTLPPNTAPVNGSPGGSASASAEGPRRLEEVELRTLTVEEAFSSTTVQQWVRQSDFVAVVRIESEQEIPPEKVEVKRGEGLIMRTLTREVDQVVWTHPKASRRPPATVSFTDFGWAFEDGLKSKHRAGVPGRPYLLPGQTYFLALRWYEWGCPGRIDPEDEPTPPTWAPLGAQAIVPFDKRLGSGEFEGYWVEDAGSGDDATSFRRQMAGQSLDWVRETLAKVAADDPKLTHKPGPIGCDGE